MLRVVTAAEAAARDAAAIRAGTPSVTLMQRAGLAAADVVLDRHAGACASGVVVVTGPGNNGGDGWVAARRLAERGVAVRVHEVLESRSPEARAERERAGPLVSVGPPSGREGVVIDALLGTGARAAPDRAIAAGVETIAALGRTGAVVVALDLPTGVDASLGAAQGAVRADLTVSFGTAKRGLLRSRGTCGEIVIVDIGLGAAANLEDGAPRLVDASFVSTQLPAIASEAHKGTRRRIAIAGGARGMAGAVVLAGRGAVRSGAGMVRLLVEHPSLAPVQAALPEATAATWPALPDEGGGLDLDFDFNWADAVLVGPGLGRTSEARDLLATLLDRWRGPTVLDADALNHFAGDVEGLASVLGGRPAVITPHAGELARLIDADVGDVNEGRFEIACDVARALGATVLLKGVPTVIFAPDGSRHVSATGTPVLAAAGSGDVLGGVVTTLLAQSNDPAWSAASGAWIHGRAAEIANVGRSVRGVTLVDVLDGLAHAWALDLASPEPPVMAVLPRVGDRA